MSPPPGSSENPVSLDLLIDGIVYVLVSGLAALDDGTGSIS